MKGLFWRLKIGNLPSGVKHSVWSVLDASLYPLVYLISVPFMLKSMGNVAFGLWIILNSLMTILQLFNFNSGIANIGIAIVRNMSHARTNNDNQFAKDSINSVLHITSVLLLIISGIGFILSYTTVKFNWWGIGNAKGINVSVCVLLASVFAGIKYFDQVFQSIIKSYEYFKLSSILNMINRFGLLAVNLFLAMNRYSIAQMLSANICFSSIYLITQYTFIKKIIPFYHFGKVMDTTLYKQVLSFSFLPWIQTLIVVFTFQSDRFWVSTFAGLEEVSSYGLASTMFNHVHMIFTAMAIWLLPRMAGMNLRNENPERLYTIVRGYLFGFIVISLMFLYFFAPFLVHLWVGNDMYLQMFGYIKSFVAFEIVFAHTILPFFYLNASGKERLATKSTLMYCGICYLFMLVALYLFKSPMAMIAGMTLSLCITMPIINFIVYICMDSVYSWRRAFTDMLPMYACVALIYLKYNSWIYGGLVILILLLLWKFYLSNLINKRVWKQLINT